jgi:hypothetical protein
MDPECYVVDVQTSARLAGCECSRAGDAHVYVLLMTTASGIVRS